MSQPRQGRSEDHLKLDALRQSLKLEHPNRPAQCCGEAEDDAVDRLALELRLPKSLRSKSLSERSCAKKRYTHEDVVGDPLLRHGAIFDDLNSLTATEAVISSH